VTPRMGSCSHVSSVSPKPGHPSKRSRPHCRKGGKGGAAEYGGRSNNKGLRHFSMKVCEKVEGKGRTTYNEVADELVNDLPGQHDPGNAPLLPRGMEVSTRYPPLQHHRCGPMGSLSACNRAQGLEEPVGGI